jgi:hypothetical protein
LDTGRGTVTEIDNGGTPDFTGTFVEGEKHTCFFFETSADIPKKNESYGSSVIESVQGTNGTDRTKESFGVFRIAFVLGSSKSL